MYVRALRIHTYIIAISIATQLLGGLDVMQSLGRVLFVLALFTCKQPLQCYNVTDTMSVFVKACWILML